jgi:phospholipid-translocating ATPase
MYVDNRISNTKYNVFTFVPKVLYEQFRYFFNLFFLLIALSQMFKALRVGFLISFVGPLVFVLLVTMIKEANDDMKRYQKDCE